MKLDWMGDYRDIVEQLIKYCNVYASLYNKEMPNSTGVSFSFAQIQVVEYLLENEDLNQNMMTIAARLGISVSTFSKLVSRLVKKELLQKYHVEGNRKDVIIRVTDEGRRIYNEYAQVISKHHFAPMFDAAGEIPREYLPLFANMLRAGLPAEIKDKKKKARLIPIKGSAQD